MTSDHIVTPVTDEFLRQFGTRWGAAWNSNDTERVVELLHPKIVWDGCDIF